MCPLISQHTHEMEVNPSLYFQDELHNFGTSKQWIFMARRAIPMIAFPRVRCMFICYSYKMRVRFITEF